MKKTLIALLAMIAATTAPADPVAYIDFSRRLTPTTTAGYNQLNPGGGSTSMSIANLQGYSGVGNGPGTSTGPTGWSFAWSSNDGLQDGTAGGTGLTAPAAVSAIFSENSYHDSIRSGDAGAPVWTTTLSGLDPSKTYDIVIFAKNSINTSNRQRGTYAITQGTAESTSTLSNLNMYNTANGVLTTFNGVAPSAMGVIQWTLTGADGGVGTGTNWRGLALNAMRITQLTPEPGGTVILLR